MANNNEKDRDFTDKVSSAAKEGFDVVHDTIDVIGDATSRTAKKATNKVSDTVNSVRDRD